MPGADCPPLVLPQMGAQADNSNMYEISARPWLYSLSLKAPPPLSQEESFLFKFVLLLLLL